MKNIRSRQHQKLCKLSVQNLVKWKVYNINSLKTAGWKSLFQNHYFKYLVHSIIFVKRAAR